MLFDTIDCKYLPILPKILMNIMDIDVGKKFIFDNWKNNSNNFISYKNDKKSFSLGIAILKISGFVRSFNRTEWNVVQKSFVEFMNQKQDIFLCGDLWLLFSILFFKIIKDFHSLTKFWQVFNDVYRVKTVFVECFIHLICTI